jgi:hypothetical protein
MEPQKKSRKLSLVVEVFVLLIGIVLGGYLVLDSRTTRANLLEQVAQNIKEYQLINDTDKDGLENWEEEIHKTDPNNPDTDQDGYLDGEEVASGYNPLQKTNDKLSTNTVQQTRPEPGNLTQMLGYILSFQIKTEEIPPTANINSLEQISGTVVDEKVTEAIQKASASFMYEFIPDYQEEEIKIADGNNLAAIRKYAGEAGNKIGGSDSCQTDLNNLKSETEIIQEAIETKNFEQINCLSNSYYQIYQSVKQVSVPLDWLHIHKEFLSIFWRFHKLHKFIPQYEKDPLKGLIIAEKFQEVNNDLFNLLQEMQIDLENR